MKALYLTTLVSAMVALGQEFVQAPMQPSAEKPIVAVPLFVNKTGGNVSRVVPGVYKDQVKNAAKESLDVDADAPNSRYVESRNVEYAPGEWNLPEVAAEVATDATASAVASAGKWRVLSRSTPTIKMINSEKLFQGTGAATEAASAFASLQQVNATYLLLGRINRFRVDETKGMAYGVQRWQVVTSVSMDLQLLNVNSGEIVVGKQMSERIVMSIPEGVSSITGIYDWEAALRAAVSKAVPEFMASVQSGPTPDVIQATAPTVTMSISSTPEGADVEFNGNFIGNTPCQVSLPAVPGVLTISAAGYEPWSKRITPNDAMKVSPTLQKTPPTPAPTPAVPQNGAIPGQNNSDVLMIQAVTLK